MYAFLRALRRELDRRGGRWPRVRAHRASWPRWSGRGTTASCSSRRWRRSRLLALLRAIRRPPRLGAMALLALVGRALHAEPALPDDLLPAGRGGALDPLPRVSSIPSGPRACRWPRGVRAGVRRRAARPRHRGDPGAAVPRRTCRTRRAAPAARARGGTTPRCSRCRPRRSSPRCCRSSTACWSTIGAATSSSSTPSISGADRRGARGARCRAIAAAGGLVQALGVIGAALPAGRLRRSHAVLLPVVRSDADDEEGPRAGHGVLPRGAAGGGLRRLRHRPAAAAARSRSGRSPIRARRARRRSRCSASSACCRRWPTVLAAPEQAARVAANAAALQVGALRLLLVVADRRRRALGGRGGGRLAAPRAAAALALVGDRRISGASTGCSSSSASPPASVPSGTTRSPRGSERNPSRSACSMSACIRGRT